MFVRVPASSANLGPGFDALGLALTMWADLGIADPVWGSVPAGARLLDDRHPATVAFRHVGGRGGLWLRSAIPEGRGLGFSGAVRVGGAALGMLQRDGRSSDRLAVGRTEVLAVAAALEGHADNVAASVLGGLVATAGDVAVRVPVALEFSVVVWVPSATTSTDAARRRLPPAVRFEDAVFNVGRTALLVAALAAGRAELLAVAAEDRLHQEHRLGPVPASRAALEAARAAGAWAAWLSGSGPSVAALCAPADAARLASALPDGGRAVVLAPDLEGVRLVGAPSPR